MSNDHRSYEETPVRRHRRSERHGGTHSGIDSLQPSPGAHPPPPRHARPRARVATTRSLISNVDVAVKSYNMKHGKYPASLDVLTQEQADGSEPLLEGEPVDPWGNELQYELQGKKRPKITSAGPDGEEGTEDDITNYEAKKK